MEMRTEEDLRNTVLDVDLSLRFLAGEGACMGRTWMWQLHTGLLPGRIVAMVQGVLKPLQKQPSLPPPTSSLRRVVGCTWNQEGRAS